MTSVYAPDWASAYADVRAAGTLVSFATVGRGAYTPATDSFAAGAATTVVGYAVQAEADAMAYAKLALIDADAATLLFVPTTRGQLPSLGALVTWGGRAYTVKAVAAIAPDGTAIAATVIVGAAADAVSGIAATESGRVRAGPSGRV